MVSFRARKELGGGDKQARIYMEIVEIEGKLTTEATDGGFAGYL